MIHRKLALIAAVMISGSTAVAQMALEENAGPGRLLDAPRLPAVPERVNMPIDPALQTRARQTIDLAFATGDAVARAQALEASVRTNDPQLVSKLEIGLRDSDDLVRFAAAMAAGDARSRAVYRTLLSRVNDSNASVRVAVRYALHRLGDKRLSQDLVRLAAHTDPRVRANAATAIGRLGEPSGVRILKPMLSDSDPAVRLQASEGLWRLGSEEGLKALLAGSVSAFSDEQTFCTLALAQPRNPTVNDMLLGRLVPDKDNRQWVEVQLAAARGLGMLGRDSGFGVAMNAARSGDARQRAMAALALGDIRRPDAQPALGPLLDAPEPEVRLAAAVALLQLAQ